MIRSVYKLLFAVALIATGCHTPKKLTGNNAGEQTRDGKTLKTNYMIVGTSSSPNAVHLLFTVTNNTNKPQRFCKWETPFEPRLGKYFEITDSKGNEAVFKGAMAKRMMPPPAEAYITVQAHGSVHAEINLADNYSFNSGCYKIVYVGGGVSGLSSGHAIEATVR